MIRLLHILLLATSLLLSCVYEPAENPDSLQSQDWFRYDTSQFAVDFPATPTFQELPFDTLVQYSIAALHNETLFHLTYTDHAEPIEPVIAYHTATTMPGNYGARLVQLAGKQALAYSHIQNKIMGHSVLLPLGKRLYVLSATSKRVIDEESWIRFKQSFQIKE